METKHPKSTSRAVLATRLIQLAAQQGKITDACLMACVHGLITITIDLPVQAIIGVDARRFAR